VSKDTQVIGSGLNVQFRAGRTRAAIRGDIEYLLVAMFALNKIDRFAPKNKES
jgi:hypothetical protein